MINVLAVAAGGAAGSVARYLLMGRVAQWLGTGFPWGTLAVNVIGCAVYGVLIELFARVWLVGGETRALLFVGFLGGFTTFSAFSFDVFMLYERGALAAAIGYVLVSVVGSILALFAAVFVLRAALS